jgi:hypothetical protein
MSFAKNEAKEIAEERHFYLHSKCAVESLSEKSEIGVHLTVGRASCPPGSTCGKTLRTGSPRYSDFSDKQPTRFR